MSSGGEALSEALSGINGKWVALIAGVFLLGLLIKILLAPTLAVEVGMAAPEFALESTDGKIFTLSQLRGVPVILTFWSTDCEDCIGELADKTSFAKAHPEIEMLGVAIDSGSLDDLADARHEHGISFPVLESNSNVQTAYGITELPVTLLIDDQGRIQQIEEGPISRARLRVWTR
jgi:peroxiredoxin